MGGGKAERIEALIDRFAALLFAGAVAFASLVGLRGTYSPAKAPVLGAIAAGLAFLLCARVLRTIRPEDRCFAVSAFELRAVELKTDELLLTDPLELLLTERVELLLTDADRLQTAESEELLLTELADVRPAELLLSEADKLRPAPSDELVLDDILAELGPDSRVVRLFDPAKMPTPAQLKSRIERHLGESSPPPASPDAAQALYDALAELRRSLR